MLEQAPKIGCFCPTRPQKTLIFPLFGPNKKMWATTGANPPKGASWEKIGNECHPVC